MEMGIESVIVVLINITILIIGWWRFRVTLEVSLKEMEIKINQNAKNIAECKNDIAMTRIEFTKEIKAVNQDIKNDFRSNAKEHKEITNILARIEAKLS